MRRTYTLLIACWAFWLPATYAQYRGQLIADSLVMSLGLEEILEIYENFYLTEELMPIDFPEVEVHKIVYRTLSGRGDSLTLASGLVALPVSEYCQYPLLTYNHGSHMYDEVISEFTARRDQHFVGVPFAANGYVAVLADYLGYGATPTDHPHPYVHAKSEATAVVDALRAAREFCIIHDVQLNDQLFLLGYSQGGHVTMATHKELQTYHQGEFTVTASAPCSGPYDFSGIMRDSMLAGGKFSNSFFIAFVTLSYQYIYQNLYDHISEAFVAPYDTLIARMLDREDPQSQYRDSLPDNGLEMFRPDFLAGVVEDSLHPLNQNIRDNDLYDWSPESPVALIYCTDDEQIPFENALFTADHMSALGADVQAYFAGHFDHGDCTYIAMLSARNWFEFYREECVTGAVASALELEESLQVFPNPSQGDFSVSVPGSAKVDIRLELVDVRGQIVYRRSDTVTASQREVAVSIDKQVPGVYFLKVFTDKDQIAAKVILD